MEQTYEVKIPNIMNPFTVDVNGKSYSFPAGTTQVVNREVYDVICNIESMVPTPDHRAGEPKFLLYADDIGYLYKSDVISEENKVSMDEVLGYAKKGMTVVVTPYTFGESTDYYYATSISKVTYEEPNYAQVWTGDSYYHSRERVVNDHPPV